MSDSKNHCQDLFHGLLPKFSSSFTVSGFTCKSLINFEFIFVYGLREWPSSSILYIVVCISFFFFKFVSSYPKLLIYPFSLLSPLVTVSLFSMSVSTQILYYLPCPFSRKMILDSGRILDPVTIIS